MLIDEHLPWRAELIDRIYWLVKLRWLAVLGTVVVVCVASVRLPGVLPVIHLLALSGLIALYNLFFYLYAHEIRVWTDADKKLKCATILVHAQIILDLLSLTLLLHYSGGGGKPILRVLCAPHHTGEYSAVPTRDTPVRVYGDVLLRDDGRPGIPRHRNAHSPGQYPGPGVVPPRNIHRGRHLRVGEHPVLRRLYRLVDYQPAPGA